MNANPEARTSLVANLTRKAFSRQSIIELAVAFRAQRPAWGSQSTLTALALNDYLAFIGWDFTVSREAFGPWYEHAERVMDPKVLPIRVSQVRELNTLLSEPRSLVLEPNEDSELGEDRAWLYTSLANYGLTHNDLPFIANLAGEDGGEGDASGFYYRVDPRLRIAIEKDLSNLKELTPLQYLHAVDPTSRKWHPNALRSAVVDYLEQIGEVSSPFSPDPPPDAPLRRRNGPPDGFLTGVGPGDSGLKA